MRQIYLMEENSFLSADACRVLSGAIYIGMHLLPGSLVALATCNFIPHEGLKKFVMRAGAGLFSYLFGLYSTWNIVKLLQVRCTVIFSRVGVRKVCQITAGELHSNHLLGVCQVSQWLSAGARSLVCKLALLWDPKSHQVVSTIEGGR